MHTSYMIDIFVADPQSYYKTRNAHLRLWVCNLDVTSEINTMLSVR